MSRSTLHRWLGRYESGGLGGLGDVSHRPLSCPHQMPGEIEAAVLEARRAHPAWGPRRICFELARRGVDPAPSESGVYRALVRAAMVEPDSRRRRRGRWRRWERGSPMELGDDRVPNIDVRANRAEVAWINSDKDAPGGLLQAGYLMYLGSDGDVSVFVSCGDTTYLVQSPGAVDADGQSPGEERVTTLLRGRDRTQSASSCVSPRMTSSRFGLDDEVKTCSRQVIADGLWSAA